MSDLELSPVIQQLSSPDPEVRYNAARSLEWRDPPPVEAIPALLRALEDDGYITEDVGDVYGGSWYEQHYVRDVAASALKRLLPEAGPALEDALASGPPQTRNQAARLLGGLGEPAFPLLMQALQDGSASLRLAAVEGMVAALEKALKDAWKGGVDPLQQETEWTQRRRRARRAIAERLLDDSAAIVDAAAEALGVREPDPDRRSVIVPVAAPIQAVLDLLEIHPDAVEQLGKALNSGGESMGHAAARALSLFPGRPDAAVVLAEAILGVECDRVARTAAESLERVGPLLPDSLLRRLMDALLEPCLHYPRPVLLSILASYGARAAAAAPAMLQLARDGDPVAATGTPLFRDIRTTAAIALGKMGSAAMPFLPAVRMMLEGDEDVLQAAHLILRQLRPFAPTLVPILAQELQSEQQSRVLAACETLAMFGPEAAGAIPEILALLKPDRPWEVVIAAGKIVAALKEAAAPAILVLVALLDEPRHRLFVLYRLADLGQYARAAEPALAALLPQLEHEERGREQARLAQEALRKIRQTDP